MCSASVSTLNVDSPSTTSPIASLMTSSKRDMCAPFWLRPSSTTHSKLAEKSCSVPLWRMRITFSTPVTPTRERLSCTAGRRAWTSVIGTLDVGCEAITYRVDGCPFPPNPIPRSLDNRADCGITPDRRIGRTRESGPPGAPGWGFSWRAYREELRGE